MKNEELDPAAAAAAAIEEMEEDNNSSLFLKSVYEEDLEEWEFSVDDLFGDISTKCPGFQLEKYTGRQLKEGVFDAKNVTKAVLSSWLLKACEALYMARRALRNGNSALGRLKSEKIEDKETIINLQGAMLKKQSAEFSAVEETVKTELKTYSQIATKNCSPPAITQKQLKTVVRETVAQEDRSRNVMVFGLEEEKEEDLQTKIAEVMEDLGEKPHLVDCHRLGRNGTKKPVKVVLRSPEVVRQVLANTRKLKQVAGRKSVYICPDRTPEDRESYAKLNKEMKKKMKEDPSHYFFIRDWKIHQADRRPPEDER